MSITITNPGGAGGITVETDPTALKLTGGDITGDLTVSSKIGIGGVVPVGATNKLAVHNGNIVFTNGFGLAFGDGSTLTSGSNIPRTNISNSFTLKQVFNPASGVAGLNIGIGGTDAGSTTAGDMWIATGGATLNFRDGLGAWRQCLNTSSAGIIQTTSTAPALRVTQMGTGEAFRVEDSTSPDTTAFVISNNGKVGIGVAPSATACLSLDTNGVLFGYSGSVVEDIANEGAASPPTGWNANSVSNAIKIRINGNFYYIPYWTA